MRIWKKILLGFISVIVIMIIVDFNALRNNIDIINKIDDLEISKRVELSQSNKIAYTLQRLNSNQREIFLEIENPEKVWEVIESGKAINESIPRLKESVRVLRNATQIGYDLSEEEDDLEREEDELLLVDSLVNMTNHFIASIQHVRKIQDENRYQEAEDLFENETEPASRKIEQLIEVIVSNAEEEVLWAVKQLNGQVDRAIQLGVYLTILSVILALSIGFYISRSISGPLNKLIAGTDQVRKGNLEANVELNTKGELQLLAESFNNMTKELKKQVSSIDKLNKELMETNDSKDAFFSIIAHDLKNPFGIILGLADILTTQYHDFDEEERKRFIYEINNSSKLIYELLENLLTWARSQSGKIKIKKENLDLKEAAEKSIASHDGNARQKNIAIVNEIPEHVTIYADKYTLSVIINNLLNNAIKFTPEGGKINFSARVEPDRVEISIKDTGVGMSKEALAGLFMSSGLPTSPGTNNEKGTGLGIILIRDFIEKNDGKFHVESEPGVGTDFRFSLPHRQQD
ncbi:MAG: HAMP domain-containing sensor histidine kinase [Prolixibacteraceae bacterium]